MRYGFETKRKVHMHVAQNYCMTRSFVSTVFLQSDTAATIYFAACFCAATTRGWCFFLWKAHRHQQRLDKVRTSDTVTVVRHLWVGALL